MLDNIRIPRRTLLATFGAALAVPMLPGRGLAVTESAATGLVTQVTDEITRIINSGQTESGMINDFERLMGRYADLPTISQSVLGPPARSATQAQLRDFSRAFQGYMARKYGRRFREFIGGNVTVTGAQDLDRFVEVVSRVDMRGSAPFEVRFRVWDRSGSPLFIDMLIEGVSLVISERSEIGALLEQNGGSIDRLTQALQRVG
ncbi:MAG: ABC transporter substrate-binding protein [Roseicyclus sp.]